MFTSENVQKFGRKHNRKLKLSVVHFVRSTGY
jgi:hypothetical protein